MDQRPPRWAIHLTAALLALAGCLVLSAATTQAAPAATARSAPGKHHPHPDHPHARPMYWGAWIGDQLTGTAPPWDMSGVETFERIVGKGMSLVEFSSPFAQCEGGTCDNFQFPTSQMEAIRVHGSIPVFSWGSEIIPREGASQPAIGLAGIIEGRYDTYIDEFATAAAVWGHPFFLRFDWEMNGDWLPWSEAVEGNAGGQYVAAWRHVHDIFTAAGATNATWVWCPYADDKDKYPNIRHFYPGSRYVDWTCLDAYNWGANPVNPQKWTSFDTLIRSTYRQLIRNVAPRKPVMLGEFASNSAGGHKAAWIRNMFKQLPRAYPRIRALVWFDAVDRGVDWPIETSSTAIKAFHAGIAPPRYAGNAFAQLARRPIRPLAR